MFRLGLGGDRGTRWGMAGSSHDPPNGYSARADRRTDGLNDCRNATAGSGMLIVRGWVEEKGSSMPGALAVAVTLMGGFILAITLLDIITTTFHPTAQSIVTAHFHRFIWRVVARLSHLMPGRGRQALLSWTLPIAVASLLLFWIFALLVGFALIYMPQLTTRGDFLSSNGPLHWGDALYVSGMCLTSIGFGDIVPREGLLRGVAVGEGIVGLLVTGVTVTYALAVFPVLPTLRVLAGTLNEETDGQVNALPMVLRYLATDSAQMLALRCRELSTDLRLLAEAHSMHPVLFYAHPRRPEDSFLRVLIVTQQLVLLLRYGLRRSEQPALVRDPRIVGLEESLIAVLRRLGGSLHLQVRGPSEQFDDPVLNADFDRLLSQLHLVKLRGDAQATPRERRLYVRFRLVTDPYIQAYSANAEYSRDDLWGTHQPLRGSTAPIYGEEDEDDDEP